MWSDNNNIFHSPTPQKIGYINKITIYVLPRERVRRIGMQTKYVTLFIIHT